MVRYLLLLVLIIIVGRVFWRVVDGVIEGLTGRSPARRTSLKSTPMVRDPVCGTFVVPETSVTLLDGPTRVYFCSAGCREKYQPRQARRA